MDGRVDYLRYVTEVLGVSQVLRSKELSAPETRVEWRARTQTGHWPDQGSVDLLILHSGSSSIFSGETAELWGKMKSAMKIAGYHVFELETEHDDLDGVLLELLEVYPAAVSLILTKTPNRSKDLRVLGSSRVLETFSPSLLLDSPELKRPAWDDLQLVMASLNSR